MPKGNNIVDSKTIRVTVSVQSERLLEQLALKGIYGRNSAEVAGRFVDEALHRFIESPKLNLESRKKRNRRNR
jgi:hypothetical protein